MGGYEDGNSLSGTQVTVALPHYDNIRKETMGETYQYFKKLIKTKSIRNLDECIDSTTKMPLFAETLHYLLIDSLQCEEEVIKILLSQNERQIKRVLRCKWFFQNLSADFCIKHVFPYVSINLRSKIINRLSRHLDSTGEAEKYFTFIRNNCGNARANTILPRCSSKFILAYFEKERPTFCYNTGGRVLLNISKRFPEIGGHILFTIYDMKGRHNDRYHHKKALHYLTCCNLDLMVPLFKKYPVMLVYDFFGRKLTKKFLKKLQGSLFPEFIKVAIDREKIPFSIIVFEDKAKFLAETVRSYLDKFSSFSWVACDSKLACLLKSVPQDKRQDLIDKAFKELYNVSFMEYPKCWSPEVLETLPTETREMYAAKLEEFAEAGINVFRKNLGCRCFSPDNPEEYLYLHDSRVAFDKFKEILWKTRKFRKRQTILCQWVKNCWINKDFKVLEEVVEFVATHHRNDEHTVLFAFIAAILKHFPISTLNSNIFEKLDDLAYFCYLKNRKNDEVYSELMERHIYHRLENGLDVDNHIKRFFEIFCANFSDLTFVRNFQTAHSKLLILLLCKEAVCWIKNGSATDEAKEVSMFRHILDTCMKYNKLNRRDPIAVRKIPGLEEILKQMMKKTYSEVGWEEWPLDVWETYYCDVTSAYHKPNAFKYVFKRRPDLIEKHLESILKILYSEYFMEYNVFFIFLIKTVSFFGKTEEMKEMILNEFQNGISVDERKIALLLYSHICTIDEFSKVIEPYLPKQDKLDRGFDEAFLDIQMFVPRVIKHVKPRYKNFQLVLKYFWGDFLKTVLSSYYSCCYNTSSDVVIPFLQNHLEEVPPKVSYVKDIIKIKLALSGKNGSAEFCIQFWEKHKHYSVRRTVLRFVSYLFLEQPTKESFQILEKCILESDEITIEALPDFDVIPENFLNAYVNALWKFSDTQQQNFKVSFRKSFLVNVNNDNINFLSKEICESIIKSHLFDERSDYTFIYFAVAYMTANPDDIESRVYVVLNLIKDRKPDAGSVYNFFKILIEEQTKKPSEVTDLYTVILKNWPEYPLGVLCEQRILFTYHNVYQKVLKRGSDGEDSFVEFGRKLKKLFAGVENLNDLLPIYVECLKQFLGQYEPSKVILSLKELVTGSQDRTVAVLAVLCMPSKAVRWYTEERINARPHIVNSRKVLDEFIKILEGYGDVILQIYMRSKFEFVKE